MNDRPPQPPEMALIERRRQAARPRLSIRQAAMRAGVSETWWRLKESGSRPTPLGYAPEHATDDAVVTMADIAGVTPDELREAGREGAAVKLESVLAERAARERADESEAEAMVAAARRPLSPRQKGALTERIAQALSELHSERD